MTLFLFSQRFKASLWATLRNSLDLLHLMHTKLRSLEGLLGAELPVIAVVALEVCLASHLDITLNLSFIR